MWFSTKKKSRKGHENLSEFYFKDHYKVNGNEVWNVVSNSIVQLNITNIKSWAKVILDYF